MRVGFAVVQQGDQARFEHSPPQERGRPDLVSFARTGAAAAALMGRLYYRHERLAELRPRLPVDLLRECAASEAALALSLYREFGPEGLERLEGDFALVLWDAGRRGCSACATPWGAIRFTGRRRGDTFALGTGLEPLLGVRGERTLSREYLADFLTMSGPREEGATELCVYEGIHRVVPGTVVLLDARTRAVRKRGYWNWLERIQDPGTDRLEEVTGQYVEALRTAVRERLRGRTSAQLSGGMDSTSVALLARELIGAGAAEGPLHTLSLVYERLPQLARADLHRQSPEREKGSRSARYPGRRPAPLRLLRYGAALRRTLLWFVGPANGSSHGRCNRTSGGCYHAHGARRDEIHDVQPYFLADLLRRGRFLKAWREAGRWARARNGSRWEVLKGFGLAALGWPWLSGGLQRNPTRLKAQMNTVCRRGSCRLSLATLNSTGVRRTLANLPPMPTANAVRHLMGFEEPAGTSSAGRVAAPLGIVIAHPFLDSRLLALGLGIQLRLRPEPGRKKPVLAEAMRGGVHRGRRAKGCFDEIYYLGLARNLPYLEAMIQNAPLEPLGMFDKGILTRQLEEASLGGDNCRQLHRLDITLSLIKWLCMQERGKRPLPPTEVIGVWSPEDAEDGLPSRAPLLGERVRPEPAGSRAG